MGADVEGGVRGIVLRPITGDRSAPRVGEALLEMEAPVASPPVSPGLRASGWARPPAVERTGAQAPGPNVQRSCARTPAVNAVLRR